MAGSTDPCAAVVYQNGMITANEVILDVNEEDPFSFLNRCVYDGSLSTGLIKIRLWGQHIPKPFDVTDGIAAVCKELTTSANEIKSHRLISYKAIEVRRLYKKFATLQESPASFAEFEEQLIDQHLWSSVHPKPMECFESFWRQLDKIPKLKEGLNSPYVADHCASLFKVRYPVSEDNPNSANVFNVSFTFLISTKF